jgi:hypothetical protein
MQISSVIYSSTRAAAFDVRIIFANDSFRLPPMAVEGTYADLSIMWIKDAKRAPSAAEERRARISLSA